MKSRYFCQNQEIDIETWLLIELPTLCGFPHFSTNIHFFSMIQHRMPHCILPPFSFVCTLSPLFCLDFRKLWSYLFFSFSSFLSFPLPIILFYLIVSYQTDTVINRKYFAGYWTTLGSFVEAWTRVAYPRVFAVILL